MRTLHTVKSLRAALSGYRDSKRRIALVPTMGNLHEGHLALVEAAKDAADIVVTSIFVNPLQFGAGEDLDRYPRTLKQDQARLETAGNHLVFAPSANEMYPAGMAAQTLSAQTMVSVPQVSALHCGASRPGHFTGVATVVNMLFNIVQPQVAVFGEKDFQQLAVIRKMVQDLWLPIDIIGLPTQRSEDGLALSSRNGFLSAQERKRAPVLYQCLCRTAAAIESGERDFEALQTQAMADLSTAGFKPDYFSIVQRETLQPARADDAAITLLAAAFLGTTRLIDNISIPLETGTG